MELDKKKIVKEITQIIDKYNMSSTETIEMCMGLVMLCYLKSGENIEYLKNHINDLSQKVESVMLARSKK